MKRFYPGSNTAILLYFVLILSSCVGSYYPYDVPLDRQQDNIYYAAKAPDLPMLTSKNEYSFSLLYGTGDKQNGLEAKATYSPVNHLGLTVNYGSSGNSKDNTYLEGGNIGVGYYTPLSTSWNFESYEGIGLRHLHNQHYTGMSNFNLTNFFVQPSIIYHDVSDKFQLAFVSKFNLVNYSFKDSSFNNDREQYTSSQVTLLINNPNQLFWEPGLVIRTGGKRVFFHLGYSYVSDLTSSELNYSKNHFSIGLHFRFPVEKQNNEIQIK
jgi:hypothetical protein